MKIERIALVVLALALMLTLGVRLGQAQVSGPAANVEARVVNGPAAAMNDVIPIQGRLTDASGIPLNGSYSITANIYDVSAGGVARCTDTDTVTVTNGLFNMEIDFCTPSDINGDQLYLGIKVESDAEMTPRQGIYAVPYAWNVRPGAIIKGADSYLFVPGTLFFKDVSTDSTRWNMAGGATAIYAGSAVVGTRHIRIPITIPAVLYGQPVRVTSVTVYYRCQNGAQNYITETELYKQTDADSFVSLVTDTTNRTSNTATSYALSTDAANYTLSSTEGALTLRLGLFFIDDTNYVQIGGVRVTLVHDY